MKCPKCQGTKWKTLETRADNENYDQPCVLRRKQCLACTSRVWTVEQLLREIVRPAPKPRKPRVVREPKPAKAKEKLKKRVFAMMELESRRDSYDVFGPDNDYLNKW